MRTILAPAALALMLGFGLCAQTGKKTTGPTPPTLNEPGVVQPKPIPEQDPASPPNVQQPVHETGREKAVTSPGRSKTQRNRAKGQSQSETTPPAASKTSPKVEQNGQVGGAQDPSRRKTPASGQTASPQK